MLREARLAAAVFVALGSEISQGRVAVSHVFLPAAFPLDLLQVDL